MIPEYKIEIVGLSEGFQFTYKWEKITTTESHLIFEFKESFVNK